jgi:hypothetical protein
MLKNVVPTWRRARLGRRVTQPLRKLRKGPEKTWQE